MSVNPEHLTHGAVHAANGLRWAVNDRVKAKEIENKEKISDLAKLNPDLASLASEFQKALGDFKQQPEAGPSGAAIIQNQVSSKDPGHGRS